MKNVTATVVQNSQCSWSGPVIVDHRSICATLSGTLCYGDNGIFNKFLRTEVRVVRLYNCLVTFVAAPLVCKNNNGQWQLSGINSVAFSCTEKSSTPAGYVKVRFTFTDEYETIRT